MVTHAFNSSTWEAEAGNLFEFKARLVYKLSPGQLGLHIETLSGKQKKKKKRKEGNHFELGTGGAHL